MRTSDEQVLALECLRLAQGNIDDARRMLAFVIGKDADAKAGDVPEDGVASPP